MPIKQLKFYTPIAMLFVCLFLMVNIISQKIIPIYGDIILTAGDFIYPLSYTLSMILTEVYGYAMSRRVIWSSFVCNILASIVIILAINLPYADSWHNQEQYASILGSAPRMLMASLGAFLFGEFIGTYILAKLKIFTHGKYLWMRTLGAISVGQLLDSLIFTTIAFIGVISMRHVIILSMAAYVCKIIYQVILTPGIYVLVGFLKKHEGLDVFDRHTNFNPFNLQ
jgi:hypothetical protein